VPSRRQAIARCRGKGPFYRDDRRRHCGLPHSRGLRGSRRRAFRAFHKSNVLGPKKLVTILGSRSGSVNLALCKEGAAPSRRLVFVPKEEHLDAWCRLRAPSGERGPTNRVAQRVTDFRSIAAHRLIEVGQDNSTIVWIPIRARRRHFSPRSEFAIQQAHDLWRRRSPFLDAIGRVGDRPGP
jgi:hypothetical protein